MKTYSIRLFPTKDQIDMLYNLSEIKVDIWNTLIYMQAQNYANTKQIYKKFDLINLLPELKNTTKQNWKVFNSKAIQSVATEVAQSYQSFFCSC